MAIDAQEGNVTLLTQDEQDMLTLSERQVSN